MVLSKMENKKRVWTKDVESLKDRTLIGKELIRVGFKKRKNSYLIEGSPSKDKPKKKQKQRRQFLYYFQTWSSSWFFSQISR